MFRIPHLTSMRESFFPLKREGVIFTDLGIQHAIRSYLYTYPFQHVVIDNFLPQDKNEHLLLYFNELLSRGYSKSPNVHTFSYREMYDVYLYWPKPELGTPYQYFYSLTYFEFLREVFSLPLTNDTIVSFHHHHRNPKDQYVHTDYTSGYFANAPLYNGINPWYFQCPHSTASEQATYRRVRALAVIYYLGAEAWSPALCGETAVFSGKTPDTIVRKINPINNRLLAFEITPWSWHALMKIMATSRNSVAQWFFIDETEQKIRFPNDPPQDFSVGY